MTNAQIEKPAWLKKRLITDDAVSGTRTMLEESGLDTVCRSSLCPNQNECFSKGQATFLLLGDTCTRACGFCSVRKDAAPAARPGGDPGKIADTVRKLGLKYAVITSVTRDDLKDGGAGEFAEAVKSIKRLMPGTKVEVLTPDFKGNAESVKTVAESSPDVFGHNIETVKRLYSTVRRGSKYRRSLKLLKYVKKINPSQLTKSSIMVGLGESLRDLSATIKDLKSVGCDILTIGQYLRPHQDNLPVRRYVTPEEFDSYKAMATKAGFKFVLSGPFVRSSYRAEECYLGAQDPVIRDQIKDNGIRTLDPGGWSLTQSNRRTI